MISLVRDVPPCPFTPQASGALPHGQIGAQHQRRRLILATARRLIAQGDDSSLTVQRLAQECDTSRQNIHNLVGAKNDIITMALLDFSNQILLHTARMGQVENPLSCFLGTCRKVTEAYPGYVAAAERIMFADYDLYQKLVKNSARHFFPFIRTNLGVLEVRKEHWEVSYQLLSVLNNPVRDWMEGGCSIDEMFDSWIFNADLIMLGASTKFKKNRG